MNSDIKYNRDKEYCYFGKCSSTLVYDLSYYGVYNPKEINSIYISFLKHYGLVSIDDRKLNTDTVNHIIHHFIEFIQELQTKITHSNISKRILLKDTGKVSRSLPSDYVFL
ncbi:hypothetical protein [Finch poxvirus]|uniref:Uncharacterized protein n=1 Tax=Condorpox virus TaxID=3049970 RepID=A0AAT9UPE4_9POXV|nr:hypothetical protein [Finch poxvirus]UOX39126.1 hypothetical protein [Finch poxvirus]